MEGLKVALVMVTIFGIFLGLAILISEMVMAAFGVL